MRNLSGLSARRAADAPGRCVHRPLDDLAAPARPMPDVVKSAQDGTDARQGLRPCQPVLIVPDATTVIMPRRSGTFQDLR